MNPVAGQVWVDKWTNDEVHVTQVTKTVVYYRYGTERDQMKPIEHFTRIFRNKETKVKADLKVLLK